MVHASNLSWAQRKYLKLASFALIFAIDRPTRICAVRSLMSGDAAVSMMVASKIQIPKTEENTVNLKFIAILGVLMLSWLHVDTHKVFGFF